MKNVSRNVSLGHPAAEQYQLSERELESYFPDVKRSGKSYKARCPAHDDHNPSLSFRRGDKVGWVFTCHRGCSPDEILAAAGLPMSAIMAATSFAPSRSSSPANRSKALGPVLERYSYEDELGTLRYSMLRFADKQFRPEMADGSRVGPAESQRVPFRLPYLVDQHTVWIVEGEKDALRLASFDLQATTNNNGAGKWSDVLTGHLVRVGVQRVNIIPDNDDTGRKHVEHVARSCHAGGIEVRVITLAGLPEKGDVSDWLAAGHTVDELRTSAAAAPAWTPPQADVIDFPRLVETPTEGGRRIRLTRASDITMKRTRWFWATPPEDGQFPDGRIPCGALALMAGREGIGKSISYAAIIAAITRGTLPGDCFGTPRDVLVVATEDSWRHTIVPRLAAAGADLERVHFMDVITADGFEDQVVLPQDNAELEARIRDVNAALAVLDPIMSRLDSAIDSHRDGETRRALEPLGQLAERTGAVVLGIIHVNKSASTDVMNSIMGSRAFGSVPRAVICVMVDPEDERSRLLGQAKNSYGRLDVPTLRFHIENTHVSDTEDGPIYTGKLVWNGSTDRTIREAMIETQAQAGADRTAKVAAKARACESWLSLYLGDHDRTAHDVYAAGKAMGFSQSTIDRAKDPAGARSEKEKGVFDGPWLWTLRPDDPHPS